MDMFVILAITAGTLLLLIGLMVAVSTRLDAKKPVHILAIGVPWILLVAASASVQYVMYEMNPDFFTADDSVGGWIIISSDVVVAVASFFAAFELLD